MNEQVQVPVAEGLFTWVDGEPYLIASRHCGTDVVSFPAEQTSDTAAEEILLSRTGTLFTWTTQQFRPPSPPYVGDESGADFQPYAVGYVEFPEGILVEGRLTESDPEMLKIGQAMQLVIVPFGTRREQDGSTEQEVVTFAFAPVSTDAHSGGSQHE